MAKKIFRTAGEVFSWLCLAVLVVCIASLLITKVQGGVPQFFGYRIYVISTGSMAPELEVGDVILSRSFRAGGALNPGDILTYEGSGETEGMLVTHRLLRSAETDGTRYAILKGDANNIEDAPVAEGRIVSRMVCRLRIFGFIFSLMQSKLGMPILILVLLVFIIIEILNFRKAVEAKKQSGEEPPADNSKNE